MRRREPVMYRRSLQSPRADFTRIAKLTDRRDDEPERLKTLVEGRELVATGSTITVPDTVEQCVKPAEPVNSGSKRP